MDKEIPTYFADAVVNVSHVNGVFRLTFAEQETGEVLRPVARLLVPAGQLGKMLGGIGMAAEDIRKKLEADSSNRGKAAAEKAAPKKAATTRAKAKPKPAK